MLLSSQIIFQYVMLFQLLFIDQSWHFLHMMKLNYFNGQMPYISMQISLEAIPEVMLEAIPF